VDCKTILKNNLNVTGHMLLRELDLDYIPSVRPVSHVVIQAIEYAQLPNQREKDFADQDTEAIYQLLCRTQMPVVSRA
jgi:hypothetical protein